MMKKILIIAVLSVLIFQSTAFALETEGEVIFRDALYGAVIGALLGSAFYLAGGEDKNDTDHFTTNIGVGVAIGTIGGLVFGVIETRSFAEIENNKVKFAVPTPVIEKKSDGLQYSASLLKARF